MDGKSHHKGRRFWSESPELPEKPGVDGKTHRKDQSAILPPRQACNRQITGKNPKLTGRVTVKTKVAALIQRLKSETRGTRILAPAPCSSKALWGSVQAG